MSADGIFADVEGITDLAAALNAIAAKARTQIGNEAVVTALTEVETAAKRHALSSKETGALHDSIGIKSKPYKRGKIIFGIVGPRKGFRRADPSGKGYRDPIKYAHLVENGTSHSPAKPFMRPAFQESKNDMITQMARIIEEGVKREAEKQASKRKRTKKT